MADTALGALFRAVYVRAGESGAPWGGRVFLDLAPLGTAMPYLVYQVQGGGEINQRRARDAEFVLLIKTLDMTLPGALACAAEVEARFNDAGQYDRAAPLDGGAEWAVLTTKQERTIHMLELVDGEPVYHEGAQFRIRMEVTS